MVEAIQKMKWKPIKIEQIAAKKRNALSMGPFGSRITKDNFVDVGVPVIRGTNLSNGRFDHKDLVFLTEGKADELVASNAFANDLVFTHRGTLGQVGIIPKGYYSRYVVSQSQMKLTCDTAKVLPIFLYYYFKSEFGLHELLSHTGGSGVPAISSPLTTLRNVEVPLPPLSTQRKIAAILSAYDDLIENNTRRIAILEEMAQSLYREWFVHFRFPDHEKNTMVESPLGMIPEGWEVKPLKIFGMIVTGKTPSTLIHEYFDKEYIPFIKTPDMHGNMFCVHTEDYLSEQGALSQKNKTIPPNSLCVNCIGALAGSVSITTVYAQTNQQINSIVLSELSDREFLYFVLLDLKETIHRHGSNGATMVNLNKGKFESLEIVYPEHNMLMKFHEATYAMFEEIKILLQRNANLRRTRDLLLPKLISGELDVEGLDIEVGDDGGDASDANPTPMVESEEASPRQDRFSWETGDIVFS